MTVMSYLGAIGAAQREAMEADPRVIIMGEDVEANVYGTMGGGKSPTPAPLPVIESLPTPPAPDMKKQQVAAPAGGGADADSMVKRRMRKNLTIASTLGTPGF
jgi:hypothetical protein